MKKRLLLTLGIVCLLLIVGVYFNTKKTPVKNVGSIIDGNAYSATTTGSYANASSTIIKLGQGTLGSVVIGVTSATTFRIMDANSITDTGSTTLLSVAASPAIGSTMTLDVAFTRGLFIDFTQASFVGRYTITYR